MSTNICKIIIVLVVAQSVAALQNGLAKTPPMGWTSWVRFGCEVDLYELQDYSIGSKLYRDMTDRLVLDGYAELGYEYVNIDDCWSELRRHPGSGNLNANQSRFPGGIDELAKFVHTKGLKLGLHGNCGRETCAGYPAQLKSLKDLNDNYFELDARNYAEWRVDSFKFDGCNLNPALLQSICPKMTTAFVTRQQTMFICAWPHHVIQERFELHESLDPLFKAALASCNTIRYYNDVEDSWLSILAIIDFTIEVQNEIARYHGPGSWFDPDQLIIGSSGLSLDQARAQMAIWCLWSAPLFMSNDLRELQTEMAKVLKNKQLIQVDQDALGVFGRMVASQDNGRCQAFVKPVEPMLNGCPSFVIVYLNRQTLGDAKYVSFKLRDLLLGVDFELVADRYEKLAKTGSKFGVDCKRLIQISSNAESNSTLYNVSDLFEEPNQSKFFWRLSLNNSLRLKVNPSGVRMVKLNQI